MESLSRVQTGTSWTTLRTTLPPEAGSSASCSSVVYDAHNLVVVGKGPNSNNSWSGSVIDMNPKNGGKVTTFIPKPGNCANQYFTCTHSDHYADVANTSVISSASPVLLLQNRYLVSIIAHNTHNHNQNHHSRKNVHGYIPQEELHIADLQKYLEKGLVTNVLDRVGSCLSRWISKTAVSNNQLFWEPILEMNHCGSALAMANNPQANTVFAVGGYQTLSPKFYQVFAAKERVSSAAYMISIDPKRMLQSSASRGNPTLVSQKQVEQAPALKKSHNKKHASAPISSSSSSSSSTLSSSQQYPNNNDRIRLPDMHSRRKNLATVVAGHYLYAIGGQDETGTTVATVERLNLSLISAAMAGYSDMKEIAWEPVAAMKTRRHGHAATTLPTMDGTTIIVVAGGSSASSSSSGNRLDSVEFLIHHDNNNQVAAEVWKPLPNLQTPRMGASLSCVNNKLIVAGGTKNPGLLDKILGSNVLDTLETLDILVSTSETISSLKVSNTAFVPAVAIGTPTIAPIFAPSFTKQSSYKDCSQRRHQQSLTASLSERVQPSAPTLEELYCYNMESASSHVAQQQSRTQIAPQKSTLATTNHDNAASHEDTDDDCWVQLPSTPPPPTPLHLPFPPPVLPPNPQQEPPQTITTLNTNQGDCDIEHDTSCAICLEHKKQVAFFCGHQVCRHCSPLVTECHICRQPIQGRIQLYGD